MDPVLAASAAVCEQDMQVQHGHSGRTSYLEKG